MIIFVFSLLIVSVYNYTSFLYNDNFFVFSEGDSATYHFHALKMSSKTFENAIAYYLSLYSLEDIGMVLISSTLYRFIASNLILNLFYIFTGLITALGIYRISSNFMSIKYAFICAVTYALSSFVLWFHASGLKESFLCMLIVLFFDRYYQYVQNRLVLHLMSSSLFLLILLFFRPALIFFCIGAVALGIILKKRKGLTGAFLIIIVFIAFMSLSSLFQSTYNRFLPGGDLDQMLMGRDSMIKGSIQFTYAVNLLAQLIGPLPTISPDTKEILSFYSAGLIYKVLLSVMFWFGVFYVFKFKAEMLYPLIFFAFFEMGSLLMIIEGLELRKSIPHFAMIYIIAFWFMDQFDLKKCFVKLKIRQRLQTIFSLSAACIFILILTWNIRYNIS